METMQGNPLGYEKVSSLIWKYSIPAIVSMLVSAIYNIVDQVFIGQGIGMLGNAATNIAFPITTLCAAIALWLGVGGTAHYSIKCGEGREKLARLYMGTALTMSVICGVIIMAVLLLFLDPWLTIFGATQEIFPYAHDYTQILAIGVPFIIFTTVGSHMVRADRSPGYSMACLLSGTLLNVVLDPIFIFGLHWGMKGAAWATVFGQMLSALMALYYFPKMSKVQLKPFELKPDLKKAAQCVGLGAAPGINQFSISIVQIVMNNTLAMYGAASIYGSDIPIACAGVIAKVSLIFTSICLGINQGIQPLLGFNYGAKKYDRVREAYFRTIWLAVIVGIIFFVAFQLFPLQIVSIFGGGDEVYMQFAKRYFRIFLMLTAINGIEPLTAGFFSAIGKTWKSILISFCRQLITLLPLIVILPHFFGIDGVLYAGPIADAICFVVAIILIYREMKWFQKALEKNE